MSRFLFTKKTEPEVPAWYTPPPWVERPLQVAKGICVYEAYQRRSAAVVLIRSDRFTYVLQVKSVRVPIMWFPAVMKAIDKNHPGPWRWIASGSEAGMADLFSQEMGVTIISVPKKDDTFVTVQPIATAWNERRLMVPAHAEWLHDFLDEMTAFTGTDDAEDSSVLALAAAFGGFSGLVNASSTAHL